MISGNINAKQEFAVLPDALQKAIRFIKATDLRTHEAGRFEMDLEGIPVILQVMDVTTNPRDQLRPEVHSVYIDVQYIVTGFERALWYADMGDNVIDANELDTPRDICFYKNRSDCKENVLELTEGAYAIYFPWDVHIPAVQTGNAPEPLRKVVMKVPVAACLPK